MRSSGSGYISDGGVTTVTPADNLYTSEEYWTWNSSKQGVPSHLANSALAVHANRAQHRGKITRKLSADSLMDYKTFQMGDPVPDLLAEQRTSTGVQTLGRGTNKGSHSHSSLSTLAAQSGGNPHGTPKRQQSLDSASDGKAQSNASRIRELQLARKPLQIKMDEFKPYQPELENKKLQSYDMKLLDGLLIVHIYCGHGLKSSRTMLRDLYCVLEVDGINKARTMIRTGAINFDWDECFEVDLEHAREVAYLVYSWDPNTRHRLCFSGSMLLNSFLGKAGKGHKVALKLEPKGVLYLECAYREPSVSLQRVPSMRKSALFGIDLETLIKREKSGLNVPILVMRCIEEVERRGLDHIGIYRLCGSAKRKAVLKDELERNVCSVDLSQDGVSDINVITGVLKDFLRELPEPLFTNSLYQMLLDALSVRMPGDPDGSAKLMLSILDCLPKANQDTLVALLDHIKKVASKCEVNKMTSHNLAVCFGPVLLCPSPQTAADMEVAMDFKKHIEVLHYLLDIWPASKASTTDNSEGSDTSSKRSMPPGPDLQPTTIPWPDDQVSPC